MQEADVSIYRCHITQAGPQLTLYSCSSSWNMQRRVSSWESTPGPCQPSTAYEQDLISVLRRSGE
eukprot:3293193-Ditylum_brightwellii.AAC.1